MPSFGGYEAFIILCCCSLLVLAIIGAIVGLIVYMNKRGDREENS